MRLTHGIIDPRNGKGAAAAPGVACYIPNPETKVYVAWNRVGVTRLVFGDIAPSWFRRTASSDAERPSCPPWLSERLSGYFAGSGEDPAKWPVDLAGTQFQQSVWRAARAIQRGDVETYATLAHRVNRPRALRAVGAAMASNPIALAVPCHRIIAAHGMLGGYAYGAALKRTLLELEGVSVSGDKVRVAQLPLFE